MYRAPVLACVLLTLFVPAVRAQEASPVPQALSALRPRPIGPANMSGRIAAVAVYEKAPRIQYVGSAGGGVWKTVNAGLTWTPVFDRAGTPSIGAVAVFPTNPDLVWVGTGEANARNSVSWGDGVYKSRDGGKTWQHLGLKETQHIGRIVLHPTDPQIAYVAALGRLWGSNRERGVFKTSDGGKTWQHVLAINEHTGVVDLDLDPGQPDTLYAAAYRVRRDAFSGGNPAVQTGPGAGLYKTTDGGKTWKPMTTGLPQRPLGRCGLWVHRGDPNVVFAVVQTDKTPVTVQGQPANKKLNRDTGGIFRSDDRGATWTHLNSLVPRPFYYGQIRVDPSDPMRVYVLGVSFHLSTDGGKTFRDGNAAKGTHVDYHDLWIDPRDPYHLVLACDGGLNYSRDRGATWQHLKNLPLSQFYAIAADTRTPYRVYGGLQDNGTWGGASATYDTAGITLADWSRVMGYDGFHCQVDPTDPNTVYCEGQYGILRRVDMRTGAMKDIRPRPDSKQGASNIVPRVGAKAPAFRFNWSSPILLSPHDPRTVYYGGNVLFRSRDRGETWTVISPDLTRGKPGSNNYAGHTISTIAESPKRAGLLYVGTDDGRIHVSPDAGKTWTELSANVPKLPQDRWITRLECSRADEGVVYLTIDRHRNDDRAPYVFRSVDRGRSWTAITAGLPADGPVHVLREDPVHANLLYVGTEFGLYVSLDRGASWHRHPHLPTVAVHDLLVQPQARELVIATHGRGLWIMDVSPLQEMRGEALTTAAYLFPIAPAQARRPRQIHGLGLQNYAGENPPSGAVIYVTLREAPAQAPVVTITDAKGKKVADLKGEKTAGLQRLRWRLQQPKTKGNVYRPVPAGTYTATLRIGDATLQRRFLVAVEE